MSRMLRIADLLRHGLLSEFVPDKTHRELRELVRYRRTLIQQRAQVVNRLQVLKVPTSNSNVARHRGCLR